MKKIVLLFLAAAATFAQLPAATGDFLYLTVTRASGAEKSYELKNLKITFTTAADMKFNGNGKEDIVPLSELANAKMRFTELATSITQAVKCETAIVGKGDMLSVTAAKDATLQVYSTDGLLVMSEKIKAGSTTVDISGLAGGIYVAKIGNKAIKIEKR